MLLILRRLGVDERSTMTLWCDDLTVETFTIVILLVGYFLALESASDIIIAWIKCQFHSSYADGYLTESSDRPRVGAAKKQKSCEIFRTTTQVTERNWDQKKRTKCRRRKQKQQLRWHSMPTRGMKMKDDDIIIICHPSEMMRMHFTGLDSRDFSCSSSNKRDGEMKWNAATLHDMVWHS